MTAEPVTTAKPKILIVEDETLVGMALADELADEGFTIAGPYSTAEAASNAVESDRPDIALLDVNLGRGRNSYALAQKLVNMGTPLLFLTGYSELKPCKDRFPGAGVLSKPVSIAAAKSEIARLLGDD